MKQNILSKLFYIWHY